MAMTDSGVLYCGDCVELMSRLESESVDCIFADPPYNLQLRRDLRRVDGSVYHGVREEWDSFESFEAYDAFTESWLGQARRLLKPTGTIWVMGTYHSIYRVGRIMQDMGFWILNEVIWEKVGAAPNFRGVRFANHHEVLIWAQPYRGGRYRFNYQLLKQMNGGRQMGSVWRLPICRGRERLRDESGRALHPTQKPEALVERVLLASTVEGDCVLDPFGGTGTTAVVASRLCRRWIVIESNERYVEAIKRRLAGTQYRLLDG